MSQGYVRFDGVWKKFRRGEVHDSLRDLIPAMWRRLRGRGGPADDVGRGEFWALRDVNFEVRPGEALGIIGHNGAGKSTALKVLTKILRPTRGAAEVHGRVGALIEVAAGFHPDLTGRENVFLQGAIMGMPVVQIRRKFDAIVEFAGLTDFIDTPVKRYSSGMNARLGFAIAAHLDPDVLIIDEVLAVGDFAFQQRAFGRIQEMVRQDIPVVVVSHQLDRIATLCTKALLLRRGAVVCQGSPVECISAYVDGSIERAVGGTAAGMALHELRLAEGEALRSGDVLSYTVTGARPADAGSAHLAIGIRVRSTQTGQVVFAVDSAKCGLTIPAGGPFTVEGELQCNVPPGVYAIESVVWNRLVDAEESPGPSVYVQVGEGTPFWGSVQMNAQMKVAAAPVLR